MLFAVDLFGNYLWLTNSKLITFAAHSFYEYAQVKDTTTKNEEFIRIVRFLYTQGQVLFQLLHEAITYVTAGNELTFFTKERRVVDAELHVHCRLIYRNDLYSFGVIIVGNSFTDLETFDTYDSTYITALYLSYPLLTHIHKHIQLFYFTALHSAVYFAQHYLLAFFQHTAGYLAYSYTAKERRIIERSDLELHRTFNYCRRWYFFQYGV